MKVASRMALCRFGTQKVLENEHREWDKNKEVGPTASLTGDRTSFKVECNVQSAFNREESTFPFFSVCSTESGKEHMMKIKDTDPFLPSE